jgi:hypothetical protein
LAKAMAGSGEPCPNTFQTLRTSIAFDASPGTALP